ncbi:hypothetical protein BMS3Abin04_01566 [bacterium BMS3Abin04]|nr:hypothetical protein BMS3Abin04_01566 [bacterium BMS3Abin04]
MAKNNFKLIIKQVAFPREHGSWGFVLEPLTLALLVAFTTDGFLIALSAFFIFLAHQPIRMLLNKKKNNHLKVKKTAFVIFFFYLVISSLLLFCAISNEALLVFIPFIIAIVMMTVYLFLELLQLNRNLFTELFAPVAITFIATSIVLAADWEIDKVFVFWVVLVSRSIPTTFYLHEKIRMLKKMTISKTLTNFSGLSFLAVIIFFGVKKLAPYLSILAVLILFVRAFIGLSYSSKKISIRKIGILEFVYGGLFVIINAIGYILMI